MSRKCTIMGLSARQAYEQLCPSLPGNNTPDVYTDVTMKELATALVKSIEKRVLDEWVRKRKMNGFEGIVVLQETTNDERRFISDRFMAEVIASEWTDEKRTSIASSLMTASAGYYPPGCPLAFHEDEDEDDEGGWCA